MPKEISCRGRLSNDLAPVCVFVVYKVPTLYSALHNLRDMHIPRPPLNYVYGPQK